MKAFRLNEVADFDQFELNPIFANVIECRKIASHKYENYAVM